MGSGCAAINNIRANRYKSCGLGGIEYAAPSATWIVNGPSKIFGRKEAFATPFFLDVVIVFGAVKNMRLAQLAHRILYLENNGDVRCAKRGLARAQQYDQPA